MDILFSDLKQYGIFGVYLYILIKEVAPFVMNKVYPERIKAEQAKRNAEALVLKNEIEEKEFQRKMQERSTAALEKVGEAVTILNERLDKLTDLTNEHNNFTVEAVTAMRETVAKNKRDTKDKIKPVRKAVK